MPHSANLLQNYVLFLIKVEIILITVELSRFCIVYLLTLKAFTNGPARDYHTVRVYT